MVVDTNPGPYPDMVSMQTNHSDHLNEARAVIPANARFWQHVRTPQHSSACAATSATATGVGSCGDKMRVDLLVENNTLVTVACKPDGCIFTMACASALSKLAQRCTIDEALQLQPEDVAEELEGLPEDHMHCARLAVNTLGDAVAEYYRRQLILAKEKRSASTAGEGE